MGHMKHATGRADRQDKRAFEQFGLSEGVRRLKANCIGNLEDILRKGILEKIGATGKGTYYVLNRKGLKGLITRDAGNGS